MSFSELLEREPEAKTAEVVIGGETFTVGAVTDPTRLLRLQEEARVRRGQIVHYAVKDGQPLGVKLNDAEVGSYLFLREGLIAGGEEGVTFEGVVKVSRSTGLDCVDAGLKVLELSETTPMEIEQEKNESREEPTTP